MKQNTASTKYVQKNMKQNTASTKYVQKNIRFNPEEQKILKKALQGHPGLSLAELIKTELRAKANRFDRMKALGKIKIVAIPSDGTWNIHIQTRIEQESWMYVGYITSGRTIVLDISEDLTKNEVWPGIKHLFGVETLKELEDVILHDVPILLPF